MNSVLNERFNFIPYMDQYEIRAIVSCISIFSFPIRVLEWGSGNSTIYFSHIINKGSTWLAIEHNQEWAIKLNKLLKELSSRAVELKHIPSDLAYKEGGDDGSYSEFKSYINYPNNIGSTLFNLIIVDGRARVECMTVGWTVLENNGVMILHDAQRPEYTAGIPKGAFLIRIINPNVYCGTDNISTLFMFKDLEVSERIFNLLDNELPSHIKIINNINKSRHCFLNEKTDQKPLCLFLNTYYDKFIINHYNSTNLKNNSYSNQLNSLQNTWFGDSDFYSKGMKLSGWRSEDLIINCWQLQSAWASENLVEYEGILDIAVEQIKQKKPDVIYFQDLNIATISFINAIRPYSKLIVGQIASPIPRNAALQNFDLIISSFPHFVSRLRNQRITAYYQSLAFSKEIEEKTNWNSRMHTLSFVGGISDAHSAGTKLLEQLALDTPIEFWGYGREHLSKNSPILSKHHGEVWGKAMFSVLKQSKITINRHIDVAENYANNMRLFEATGCGALLITDYKDNLNELFEIGKEIVAYRSIEECVALIHYYLKHPDQAAEIATRGQKRTLQDHNYNSRMIKTSEILKRHLRYKWFDKPEIFDISSISSKYSSYSCEEVTERQERAWKDNSIPKKQRALVQKELEGMYVNNIPIHYQKLADCIKPIINNKSSLLEIGCASGYYYEILEYLLSMNLKYTGIDYSPSLIAMANDYYPNANFCVADAASMPFKQREFDIVISSCVLLHVKDYIRHLAETFRVAKKYIVLHRTPITRKLKTKYYKKLAYGVETFEIRFNESEIISLLLDNGFKLISDHKIISDHLKENYDITYLFERIF